LRLLLRYRIERVGGRVFASNDRLHAAYLWKDCMFSARYRHCAGSGIAVTASLVAAALVGLRVLWAGGNGCCGEPATAVCAVPAATCCQHACCSNTAPLTSSSSNLPRRPACGGMCGEPCCGEDMLLLCAARETTVGAWLGRPGVAAPAWVLRRLLEAHQPQPSSASPRDAPVGLNARRQSCILRC
jgi:hypothetical protein